MKKQRIVSYISQDLSETQLVLSSMNSELIKPSELPKGEKPDYALVDSVELMDKLRGEFESLNQDVKFIFLGRNGKVQDFFDLNGAMMIDPLMFKNKTSSLLIKRSISENPGIQLQEIFGENFKKYYSYKINNIYRLGYVGDLICKDAIDVKLNFIAMRTFFDHAMMLNSYLVDLGLASFPCEVEFTFKEDQFVMLLHIATANLKHNQLCESLGEENSKNPMSSLLKTCFKQADYLDVVNYPKAKRLTIIGLWLSEEQRAQLTTPSISIQTIVEDSATVKNESESSADFNYDFNHQLDPTELEKLENADLPELPGAHRLLEEMSDDSVFNKEEGLLEEITSFVQNQVELKNLDFDDPTQAINVSDLSIDEVKKILKDHPNQELVQSFKKDEEELLTSVVTAGKNAEKLIQTVRGKVAKEDNEIKVSLSSAVEEITNQIVTGGSLFKENLGNDVQFINSSLKDKEANEILVNPASVFEGAEFNFEGNVISFDADQKKDMTEVLQNSFDELLLSPDFQSLSKDEQQKRVEQEVKLVIKSNMPKAKEEQSAIKIAMGNIQKELVTKFTSQGKTRDADEQIEIVTSSILKNAKEFKTVLKGGQTVHEAVEEIIVQMSVPEEQKIAFKKKIQQKIKKENLKSSLLVDQEPELGAEVLEEIEQEETVQQNRLVKKVVNVSKQVLKNNMAEVEEIVEAPESESSILAQNMTNKKSLLPQIDSIKLSGQVDEDDKVEVISGDGEFDTGDEYVVKKSSGSKSKKSSEAVVVVGSDDGEVDDDDGYSIRSSTGKSPKKSEGKRVITGNDGLSQNDGYVVKSGKEGSDKDEDEGYVVSSRTSGDAKNDGADYKVSNNSNLLMRIEELEKKLKRERDQIREMEKAKVAAKEKVKAVKESVSEITKTIKNPDLTVEATDPVKLEAVVADIKNSSGLSDMQKEKMLEMLEKEKLINIKYAEIQDAYRKTKAALDTQENKYSAEIDELERSNRHKELLVEQMKTKVSNAEKDHQLELKRVALDLKKQAQRGSSVEVDRYKQKAAALEREKNAMKRMLDELKNNVSMEKVKAVNQDVKSSPKVAEFEAQKKRAEVKLMGVEAEIKELKKSMAAKDLAAKEVGEQRFKYETEMNKWKKEALTKQSEIDKALNEVSAKKSEVEKAMKEKKHVEEELQVLKKLYDETVQAAKKAKKSDATAAQAVQDSKASSESAKNVEDKLQSLKEENLKEKAHLNKELVKEKEQLEEMKRSYLNESNKVKALENKAKEMASKIEEQAAALKAFETAEKDSATITTGGSGAVTAKDLSALSTKNRILEETSKKVTKDFNETKGKLDEAKKEIANLTKKTNEVQFKLQEKEKLAEKLQNELKAIKDKEAEAKKKETEAKKAA